MCKLNGGGKLAVPVEGLIINWLPFGASAPNVPERK